MALIPASSDSRGRSGDYSLRHAHVSEIHYKRILTAAVEAIAELGYARTTVTQIVGRAKVSRKTFYDVFGSREECLLAIFEHAVADAELLAVRAYEGEPSWCEGTRAALGRLLRLIDEEPELARICLVEALVGGDRVLGRRARLVEELARAVDRGAGAAASVGGPQQLTAEAVVGGVLSVLHTRMLDEGRAPAIRLLGPLMAVIVLPYLGREAAESELSRSAPAPGRRRSARGRRRDPLEGLDMRLTYRTVRVLAAISERPGASNREIGDRSGISDPGQVSKLLSRLSGLSLIENRSLGQGTVNSWRLTTRGAQVERATRPYPGAHRASST
jgi:AcrR family transcriptional regulator